MTAARPGSKPKITREEVLALVAKHHPGVALPAVAVVGIRGYYRDSMGQKGVNDRGIYDDAIIVLTPQTFAAFNGNTDPSRVRKGKGTGAGKGMARLKPGLYQAHQLGQHRAGTPSGHPALVQRAGKVTVIRDGISGDYEETGFFGINIHRGGNTTTSSEGCQTLPPDQWPVFYANVRAALSSYGQAVLTYVLIEGVD